MILDRPFKYKETPSGFYLYQDKLIISHGRLGFSVFDITKRKVVSQQKFLPEQFPLESMAIGVAGFEHFAIFAVDNFTLSDPGTKTAFRGLLVVDLDTGAILRKIPGLDPGAESIQLMGNRVFVGFNPPIWKYDLQTILSTNKAAPISVVSQLPENGMFVGKTEYDEENVYGCYNTLSPQTHQGIVKPVGFSRKDLKLD